MLKQLIKKRHIFLIPLLLFCLRLPQEAHGTNTFKDGIRAYKKYEFKKARRIWEVLAEEGDMSAQLWMGVIFMLGKGVERNYATAYYWLQLASVGYPYETNILLEWIRPRLTYDQIYDIDQKIQQWSPIFGESIGLIPEAFAGDSFASHQLGSMFLYDASEEDYRIAAKWLKRATSQGDSVAAFKLGFLFDAGLGVHENDHVARKLYQKAAKKGVIDAWVMLAILFFENKTVPEHEALALRILQETAQKGHTIAQLILGEYYINIYGLPRDTEKGIHWLSKAADKGDSDAQNLLGLVYFTGHGIEQNLGYARSWFEKAAAQNHPEAIYNIGVMHHMNHGTPKNLKLAVIWYKRAAHYGIPNAYLALAQIYLSGYQVRSDCIKAYTWATLAAAGSDKKVSDEAREIIQALKYAMPPEDVIEAQKEAYIYWKSIYR